MSIRVDFLDEALYAGVNLSATLERALTEELAKHTFLQLESRVSRECVSFGVSGAECFDHLHQVIEHFEWAS